MSFTIDFQPTGTRLACEEPTVLRDAALRAGVPLNSVCGGKATCGKCLVQVTSSTLSPVTDEERRLLSAAEIAAGYRQACRTVVGADASVYVPPTSRLEGHQLQVDGIETPVAVDAAVQKVHVHLPEATLADARGDFDRLADALKLTRADLPVLAQLSTAVREGKWEITAAVRDGELISVQTGDTTSTALGLAVDLGTTKIACYLVDLISGRTLAARGIMNPQIPFGEDVITRIQAVDEDAHMLPRLRDAVVAAINEAAADLCAGAGVTPSDILEMAIVGNTAMHHLALGLPVSQLGVIPFAPVIASPIDVKCSALGLIAAPGAYVHLPPPIAGFVGSDHVAVLLASTFHKDERTRLMVDLGTNTEIGLQAKGEIRACSTACGPAFEGAHIRFGMRAAPGAIEHVKIDATRGMVHCTTIGGKPPVGICGSGILDAIAELLRVGWMNERGRLIAGPSVRQGQDGLEFVLARSGEHGGREIVLSQKDLREIQLAKGAIRAGIDILLEEMSVAPTDIDEVIVAGAFGTYLDPASAVRVGILPRVPVARVRQVGNAAGVGAKQVLISRAARVEAARLAKRTGYLELTLHPEFQERFARAMLYTR